MSCEGKVVSGCPAVLRPLSNHTPLLSLDGRLFDVEYNSASVKNWPLLSPMTGGCLGWLKY